MFTVKKVGFFVAVAALGAAALLIYVLQLDLLLERKDSVWLAKERALAVLKELEQAQMTVKAALEIQDSQPSGLGTLRLRPDVESIIKAADSILALGLLDAAGGSSVGSGANSSSGNRVALEQLPIGILDRVSEQLKTENTVIMPLGQEGSLLMGVRPEGSGVGAAAVLRIDFKHLSRSGSRDQAVYLLTSGGEVIVGPEAGEGVQYFVPSTVSQALQSGSEESAPKMDEIFVDSESGLEIALAPVGFADLWVAVPIAPNRVGQAFGQSVSVAVLVYWSALMAAFAVLLLVSKRRTEAPRSTSDLSTNPLQSLQSNGPMADFESDLSDHSKSDALRPFGGKNS